jgi:hypothetical protein
VTPHEAIRYTGEVMLMVARLHLPGEGSAHERIEIRLSRPSTGNIG